MDDRPLPDAVNAYAVRRVLAVWQHAAIGDHPRLYVWQHIGRCEHVRLEMLRSARPPKAMPGSAPATASPAERRHAVRSMLGDDLSQDADIDHPLWSLKLDNGLHTQPIKDIGHSGRVRLFLLYLKYFDCGPRLNRVAKMFKHQAFKTAYSVRLARH